MKIMCDVFFRKLENICTIGLGQVLGGGLGLGRRAVDGRRVGWGWGKGGASTEDEADGWPAMGAVGGGGGALERGRRHTSFYFLFFKLD
jgi:hypothetical protein